MICHYGSIAIVVHTTVDCYKCLETYVYCAVFIMMAANVINGRLMIHYPRWLTKLKVDLSETIKKYISHQSTITPKRMRLQFFFAPTWFRYFVRG
jgi:hypothetical protein